MRFVFRVPIHGAFLTLLALALPFVLTMLGLGLLISTQGGHARRGEADGDGDDPAVDLPVGLRLPDRLDADGSSGGCRNVIPTTWLIDAARGVILRGAGWPELWPHAVVLWGMAVVTLTVASLQLRKRLA